MGDFLEKRLEELGKTKRLLKLKPGKKNLYFNLVRDVFGKITGDCDIKEEDLFKKTRKPEISLPRQEVQYEIIKDSIKILEKECYSLTAELFKSTQATIRYSCSEIKKKRFLQKSESETEQEEKSQFFKILRHVHEKLSDYKDLLKDKGTMYQQLFYHQIIEGNKKTFGHENSSLTANLLGVPYEKILLSYHRIEVLKDYSDQEGEIIREVLFKGNSKS